MCTYIYLYMYSDVHIDPHSTSRKAYLYDMSLYQHNANVRSTQTCTLYEHGPKFHNLSSSPLAHRQKISAYTTTAITYVVAEFPRGAGEILAEHNPRPDSIPI